MPTTKPKRTERRRCPEVVLAGAMAAALVWCTAVRAESIWDRRSSRWAELYSDNVAARVGDSLTVLIADKVSFSRSREVDLAADANHNSDLSVKTNGETLFRTFDLGQSSARSRSSANQHTNSWRFSDSITATVVDVLPNGNLVIAGRTEREVAGERVMTVLTGIVKPEDISAGNSVSSLRVAHSRTYQETSGPADTFMEPGWITWIIDTINPF